MEYFRQRFIDELNEEGDIEIGGLRWTRHVVLESLDPVAAANVFSSWTDQTKAAAIDRAKDFLTTSGCIDRFRHLCHLHREQNVVPFVGAGMSVPSGFQPWGGFLLSLLPDAPRIREEVDEHIHLGRFEEAAQVVRDTLGDGVMTEEIHTRLGRHHQRVMGPISLLPLIFQRQVITTNFDYVLSHVYRTAKLQFDAEFCGVALRDAIRRLANDPHCLLRLHGEADTANGRVLTAVEYEEAYGVEGSLHELLAALIGVRSFLFMGCSLTSDRTYAALREMHRRAIVHRSPHYAFLPLPKQAERLSRRKFLAEAGIHPIYYTEGEHDQSIEDLLVALLAGGLDVV